MLDWKWMMGRDMVEHRWKGRCNCSLGPWLKKMVPDRLDNTWQSDRSRRGCRELSV